MLGSTCRFRRYDLFESGRNPVSLSWARPTAPWCWLFGLQLLALDALNDAVLQVVLLGRPHCSRGWGTEVVIWPLHLFGHIQGWLSGAKHPRLFLLLLFEQRAAHAVQAQPPGLRGGDNLSKSPGCWMGLLVVGPAHLFSQAWGKQLPSESQGG